MFDMKIISVGSSVFTHLALVPSAVANTNLSATYYDRATFPAREASVSVSVTLRYCLLDAQFDTLLDTFL